MCLPWSISTVMMHNLAQNAFLIYTGFSASNGGHFSVYSTTFLPFFERKFDAYLRQICLFDAYLRRSGGFMCQMSISSAAKSTSIGRSVARWSRVMKRSRAWKSGGPGPGSICYGSTGAGRIGIGGIGGGSSQRTYALSGIHPRCVRGLLSHNDNDPLQQRLLCV